MAALVINSPESLQRAIGAIRQQWEQHKFLRLNVRTGKDRSLDQNAITHAWYSQIAQALPEDDALGWKCYCKLNYGVPIMRAGDEQFRETYDAAIKHSMTYEQKLMAMRIVPVTSLMNVKQLSAYAEAIQSDFRRIGVNLEFPEDS
ncbi:hypothetical protein [Pandoraea apista]|uniref:hypothetical protein n=1 Tax=Pandoraea apista TaxID=93218 RepID=UPI000F6867B5|nr:hypothetical protein [Pandoraea apista]RRW90612.1 hypothetical protein EGJ54_21920 [Pandoraea apista]RRX00404.1 hypothetical protein EGJ56_19165 [Pandoraea apista]